MRRRDFSKSVLALGLGAPAAVAAEATDENSKTMTRPTRIGGASLLAVALTISGALGADRLPRLGRCVENLLVRAQISGNVESFGKGLRGAADHMVYDLQRAEFVKPSQYNEYGVGFQQDLGVVPEDRAAW